MAWQGWILTSAPLDAFVASGQYLELSSVMAATSLLLREKFFVVVEKFVADRVAAW